MLRPARVLALLLGSLLLPGCFLGEHALTARESVALTRPLASGGAFRLRNVNGRVSLSTWDKAQVEIDAVKKASSEQALRQIEIEIADGSDHVDVTTRTPRGFFGGYLVDYDVRVPQGVRVEVETVNGSINLEGALASTRVKTVNGSVEVLEARGEVEAQAVNGRIEVQSPAVAASDRYRLSTTNGSVELRLPREVSGSFEAHAVNGSISTDLPLRVEGRFGPKRLSGQVGSGGGRYELRTVNGSVSIHVLK
jgi:hypothetical protein